MFMKKSEIRKNQGDKQLYSAQIGICEGSRVRAAMAMVLMFSWLVGLILVGCGGSGREDDVKPTVSLLEDGEAAIIDKEISSSDSPQFEGSAFSDLDCGESCGFRVGEYYVTMETSACGPGDPRVGATIPFDPDKAFEIRLGDLNLASEIVSSGN